MIKLIKRVKNKIWRKIDPSDKARIRRLAKNPPKIDSRSIVFNSSDDYTGNPKALFLYMIEHGYNKRYHITWLFEKEENYFKFDIPNVDSAIIYDKDRNKRAKAQKAIMSARYIFYSHNVNWCKSFREGQTFIDLWHGCGYKDDMRSVKRVIYYDHLIVTGSKYIDIFKRVLKKPDGDILDLGYPRNEMLFSSRSNAIWLLERLKSTSRADKAVIWMPTFRKSTIARLETDTGLGETGLPILCETDEIVAFDEWCRKLKVLIIIKQHMFQKDYLKPDGLTNILFIDEDYLRDNDADLYEVIGRTDALITDYSSVAIDYLLVDKPLGYTLDDYDRYESARGFSFENVKEYMPGHHIYGAEDLKQFISDISENRDPHAEWRARIRPEMQTYTDGFSKRILDYFGIK